MIIWLMVIMVRSPAILYWIAYLGQSWQRAPLAGRWWRWPDSGYVKSGLLSCPLIDWNRKFVSDFKINRTVSIIIMSNHHQHHRHHHRPLVCHSTSHGLCCCFSSYSKSIQIQGYHASTRPIPIQFSLFVASIVFQSSSSLSSSLLLRSSV